jgi:hypothetical protein
MRSVEPVAIQPHPSPVGIGLPQYRDHQVRLVEHFHRDAAPETPLDDILRADHQVLS